FRLSKAPKWAILSHTHFVLPWPEMLGKPYPPFEIQHDTSPLRRAEFVVKELALRQGELSRSDVDLEECFGKAQAAFMLIGDVPPILDLSIQDTKMRYAKALNIMVSLASDYYKLHNPAKA